jgi:hypothetical protein
MTTLADFRARLRVDLHDADAANYRWTDAELDRALTRAVRRYSHAWPLELAQPYEAIEAQWSFDIISGYAGVAYFIGIREVEYPAGQNPPVLVPYRFQPPKTLHILIPESMRAGEYFTVHLDLFHTVDAAGSTVPPYHEEIVENGAAGYAASAWASFAINRVNVDANAAEHYRRWGAERLSQFQRDLTEL